MVGQRILILSSGGVQLPLDTYIPEVSSEIDAKPRRRSVVICPGGGYHFLSQRESEPVALAFAAAGFNVFVVWNRVAPYRFPLPQQDAAAAVAHVRTHADEYHANPDQIAILGFSAGGHLAGSLGTLWHRPEYWQEMGLACESVRPNAMVLCYPVLSGGVYAHRDSFINLCGTDALDVHARHSVDRWVTPCCPPTFLWHTFDDEAVPVQNSLLMAQALAEAGVRTELHVFPHGGHGASLCSAPSSGVVNPQFNDAYNAQWLPMAQNFLNHVMA